MLDGITSKRFFRTVLFETNGNHSELNMHHRQSRHLMDPRPRTYLLAPVAKVIHTDYVPSIGFVDVRQETSNDCRAEVADVELLSNIWGRIFYFIIIN
jgi:hypothetical protein